MINFSSITTDAFLQAFLLMLLAAYSQYVVFRAGVFSTATVGFMAIGAYTTAILTTREHIPTFAAVVASVALCGAIGVLLGRLIDRLRGAYQAIATFAFVEIIQALIIDWTSFTNGIQGVVGIPFWATSSVLVILGVLIIVVVAVVELLPLGRRQRAGFYDEIAAASCGVNIARTRLLAIVFSAAIGGVAGAAQAGNQLAVDSSTFGFSMIVIVLAAVIIGGTRSFLGPAVGAFVVTALPLVFSNYQGFGSISVAIVTILIMLLLPRGIATLTPIDSSRLYRLAHRYRWRNATSTDLAESGFLSSSALGGHRVGGSLVMSQAQRHFGAVRAVNGVSVEVAPGQVVGLIGPNGAGKSTVMNMIAGLTALDRGTVTVGGRRIEKLPSFRVEHTGIARTFQTCRLFAEQSVWDNVLLAACSGRTRTKRRQISDHVCAAAALAMVGCSGIAEQIAPELPYAHQRRVEIARALATEPEFLLLDEPAAGMLESEAAKLAEVVRRVAESGIGVLVIDHNVSWICSISDFVIVQNFGEVIASGPPQEIVGNPLVIEAYIGNVTERQDPQNSIGAD